MQFLPHAPPFSYSPQIRDDELRQALADGSTFLARTWQPGLTPIIVVHHASGCTATVCVNCDEDSVFFEAWRDDAFFEPCYSLQDALTCARDLLNDSQ